MIPSVVEFLVMINPFALFLYLDPVRKDLSAKAFNILLLKATLISFIISLVFFFSGTLFFEKVFHINFESFRIFGGIIIFSYAYFYIVKGQKALIIIKEDLNDLASEIALPFMVGAGTISLSIILSQKTTWAIGSLTLLIIYALSYFIIFVLNQFRKSIEKRKFRTAFDKNLEVLLRLNGFFIGAIGINMMLTGIQNMFSY